MKNGLMTEEYKSKKSYGKLILIFIFIILIVLLVVGISYLISNNKKKKEVEVYTVNEELKDVYAFGIVDKYIVGINEDNSIFKIYNINQGTGQLGNFTGYFYNDNKLYLIFSDNNIYSISLESGNSVYELTKVYSLPQVECLNKESKVTSDIAFVNNSVFVNPSSCAIEKITLGKKINSQIIKTFNKPGSKIEYSKKANSLYVYSDNTISKYNLKTGEISNIVENVNVDMFKLQNNILIYSDTKDNNKTFYGYNVINGANTSIVSNASELVMYNNTFIYRTDTGIYLIKGTDKKEIYTPHYNNLSNMELFGDTLQIVDKDTNDIEKVRIINIDLKDKYKTSISNYEIDNVIKYNK